MFHQTPYSLSYSQVQPQPRFCIFRPGGRLAPLIPADELPSWLHIGNFGPDLTAALQPVSLSFIPREGEYDVICHHCSSSVDSLHQSTSERNSDSQSPQSATSQTRSCPGTFFTQAIDCDVQAVVQPIGITGQAPVQAAVQNPYLGIYMLQMPAISSNVMPSVMRTPAAMEKARDIASTCSHIGSDLFEKTFAQGEHPTSGSDADSERSVLGTEKTAMPASAERVDSPDPRVDHISSPNSRTGFDAAAEIASRIQESALRDDSHDTRTVLEASIASTRSLTAAVLRLGQLMEEGKIRRPSNFDLGRLHRTGFKEDSETRPRAPSVHVPSKRVRVRHRRRRADKSAKSKPDAPKVSEEPKPEQENSATKRRERRQKLNRGKKDTGSPSRFAHMTAMQNGHELPHR
ncbi:uncharacterized protein N7473_009465 [Penicillium subrubescens]|uniref:Uncharacterized protein n=1 Tax=Penicillium subrubescens TaxID=1316194 RepID=A0A1Q5TB75_9EURO|nr:uncharacterized protein N7473_009465 [Penicillium subrubescens]KAJ5886791.1 hypothetical protein N7473_009465 [Penicillium subrubescens]OKO97463.1 hypothetical protein PENSUB_10257 [Penicillium subrubescens]